MCVCGCMCAAIIEIRMGLEAVSKSPSDPDWKSCPWNLVFLVWMKAFGRRQESFPKSIKMGSNPNWCRIKASILRGIWSF